MDLTPSSIIKGLGGFLGSAATLTSYAHSISAIFDVLKGHEPPKDAPTLVKGFHGIFGHGDERTMEVLINQLEDRWKKSRSKKKGPNPREVLVGFLVWHFPHNTAEQRVLTWWYGNAFRAFVTGMKSSEGHKVGSKEQIVETKNPTVGTTTKTVCSEDLMSSGSNNSLDFLDMMVETITSEPEQAVEPKRLAGYKKLLRQFDALHVPHIPDGAEDDLKKIRDTLPAEVIAKYRIVKAGVIGHVRRSERKVKIMERVPKSPLGKLIRWI